MKLHNLEGLDKYNCEQEYEGHCDQCGKLYIIHAQEDKEPEYYTDIYLKCGYCSDDNYIHFHLPVN